MCVYVCSNERCDCHIFMAKQKKQENDNKLKEGTNISQREKKKTTQPKKNWLYEKRKIENKKNE